MLDYEILGYAVDTRINEDDQYVRTEVDTEDEAVELANKMWFKGRQVRLLKIEAALDW